MGTTLQLGLIFSNLKLILVENLFKKNRNFLIIVILLFKFFSDKIKKFFFQTVTTYI